MKYIVLRAHIAGDDMAREYPFVFADNCVHSFVAAQMKAMLEMTLPVGTVVTAVSAGDVSSTAFVRQSFTGKSITLQIKSRGVQDEALMGMYDYKHGIVDVDVCRPAVPPAVKRPRRRRS